MNRDNFPKTLIDSLAKRAAFICSNPECRALTVAPSMEHESKFIFAGRVAHISAAAPGGPRYDETIDPDKRKAASNAIFLCSFCSDMVDKNKGIDFSIKKLLSWKKDHEEWVTSNLNKREEGRGGNGGGGVIKGNRGVVVGGRGGDGGASGVGGAGGSGYIDGDDGLVIGGDGGNAGTSDGRGGRGARGPTERFGVRTDFWGFGRGGYGRNHPEYDRRLSLLKSIREEYLDKFPNDALFIEAGVDHVPVDWVNQRLVESGETWQIAAGASGYSLPPLGSGARET